LEAHVGKDHRASLACESECGLKVHLVFLHEKRDNDRSTPGYASMAVDKNTTTLHAFFDERNSCREVPDQT
jgi:hypothetical protein